MTSERAGEAEVRRRIASAANWAASQPWNLTPAEVRRRRQNPLSARTAVGVCVAILLATLFGSLAGAGVFSSNPRALSLFQRHPPQGHVAGQLVAVHGPSSVGIQGRVIFLSTHDMQSRTAQTGPTGLFSLTLPTGTYTVVGYSPKAMADGKELRCSSATKITVHSRIVTRDVRIVCVDQ